MRNKVLYKVSSKERQKMVELIEVAQPLLQLIKKKCLEDYDKFDKVDDEDFKNPNWAIEQAYKLGVKKGLTMLSEYVIIRDVKS